MPRPANMHERFPRVARYLAELPDGTDSYSECVSKASIQQSLLRRFPVQCPPGSLPDPVEQWLRDPPLPSAWKPTVLGNAVELAVADAHCANDAEFEEMARWMNRVLLSSPMYKVLVFVMSPGFLLKQTSSTWGRFHRGTTLDAEIGRKSAWLTMTFPRFLHPLLILKEKAIAFEVAMAAAGGGNAKARITERTPKRAVFHVTWE